MALCFINHLTFQAWILLNWVRLYMKSYFFFSFLPFSPFSDNAYQNINGGWNCVHFFVFWPSTIQHTRKKECTSRLRKSVPVKQISSKNNTDVNAVCIRFEIRKTISCKYIFIKFQTNQTFIVWKWIWIQRLSRQNQLFQVTLCQNISNILRYYVLPREKY